MRRLEMQLLGKAMVKALRHKTLNGKTEDGWTPMQSVCRYLRESDTNILACVAGNYRNEDGEFRFERFVDESGRYWLRSIEALGYAEPDREFAEPDRSAGAPHQSDDDWGDQWQGEGEAKLEETDRSAGAPDDDWGDQWQGVGEAKLEDPDRSAGAPPASDGNWEWQGEGEAKLEECEAKEENEEYSPTSPAEWTPQMQQVAARQQALQQELKESTASLEQDIDKLNLMQQQHMQMMQQQELQQVLQEKQRLEMRQQQEIEEKQRQKRQRLDDEEGEDLAKSCEARRAAEMEAEGAHMLKLQEQRAVAAAVAAAAYRPSPPPPQPRWSPPGHIATAAAPAAWRPPPPSWQPPSPQWQPPPPSPQWQPPPPPKFQPHDVRYQAFLSLKRELGI